MDAIIIFTMVKFSEWLDTELNNRGWTRAELARRAGVHQSTISMAYSGQRNVGPDLAESIARAFGIQPEEVFRVAGLLPPSKDEKSDNREEIMFFYDQLSPEDQAEILDLLRFKAERTKKQTSRGKRPARNALKES
jgi:transcriptional regulator with XRE-family HTH domain